MIVLCSVSLNSASSSSFIPYPLPGRPSLREMDETKPLLTGPSPVAPIEQPPPYEEPVAPGMTIKNKYIGSVLEL